MQPIPVMEGTVDAVTESRSFLVKVYMWMSAGLFITAGVSIAPILALGESTYTELLLENIPIFYGLLIFEVLLVWGLSAIMHKIPSILGVLIFLFYSFLNGVTLSPIFIVYTGGSIFSTFAVCAIMFGGTSILGYITKMDLSRFGAFFMMALFGLLGAMVVNLFLQSDGMSWIISLIGVLLFVGLTAYDTQKLKNMSSGIDSASEEGRKASIMGALTLYLDFINLFLFLLRLLGRRR